MHWNKIAVQLFAWFVYLGLPAVKVYHEIRLSPFLNTAAEDAIGLEKWGNIVLSPVQYLMDGQIAVTTKNGGEYGYTLCPRFSYDKNLSLYGCLSIFCSATSLCLGSFLKGIACLQTSILQKQEEIYRWVSSTSVYSNHQYYQGVGIPIISKEKAEWLETQGYKRKKEINQKLGYFKEGLQEIVTLLDKHQIPYWLDCGTLLGAYRYGGAIPWDSDMDIAILLPDFENVRRALNQLDPNIAICQDWSSRSCPRTYFRVYIKKAHDHIDVYGFKVDPEKKQVQYILSFENSDFMPKSLIEWEKRFTKPHPFERVFPLKRALFDGMEVWVPRDTVAFLQSEYGKDLRPTMLFNEESDAYEKDLSHPYWSGIGLE